MNHQTEAFNSLFDAFPSLRRWWDENGDSVRELWRDILGRCDQTDIDAVVQDIKLGVIELPKYYDYDRLAILVRRHCESRASDRRARTEEQQKRERLRAYARTANAPVAENLTLPSIIKGILEAKALLSNGVLTQEAYDERIAALKQSIMPGAAVYDQPKYKCPECRDTGKIEIYSPEGIARARGRGEPTRRDRVMQMVACNLCDEGERMAEGNRHWSPLRKYNALSDYRPIRYDWDEFCRLIHQPTGSDANV